MFREFLLKLFSILTLCSLVTASFSQENRQKEFKDCQVKGSVSIYDYNHQRWFFTDSADAQRRTLPASTFKMINTCIALETNVIKNENEVIKWDGKTKTFFGTPIPAWNKDSDLKMAFQNSTIWFYVKLAERIGRTRYRKWLRRCHYGNDNLSEKGTDFWNYGHFGISPKEQLLFLKAFYEEKLPFSRRTYEIAKRIMITEQNSNWTLRSKTGWTKSDGKDIGWYIGYYTTPENTYFFATRLWKDTAAINPNFALCRKTITSLVLDSLKKLNKLHD